MTLRTLVVHTDGSHEVTQVEDQLTALQAAIGGGWIEGVSSAIDADWHAYCDEEGKLKGLPMNLVATTLAHALGWIADDVLVGDVIFLGNGEDGAEADVPERVIQTLNNMIGSSD